MKVRFISLASGSSGNCYYIGTEKYGILIDAGIAVRTIKKGLKEAGINMEMIRAVFVTHDHADHIKAVGGLGEKLNIPIYTTARIHEGINKSYCMTEKLHSSVRYLEKQQPMQQCGILHRDRRKGILFSYRPRRNNSYRSTLYLQSQLFDTGSQLR